MQLQVILLHLVLSSCQGARILLVPFPFPSHVSEFTQIGEALAAKGHEMHILMTQCYKLMDRLEGLPINIITHESKDDIWCGPLSEMGKLLNQCISVPFKQEFRQRIPGIINLCKNILSDEKTIAKLVSMQFDLVLIDNVQWTRCFYVLPYKIGVPHASVYTNYEPWLSRSPQIPSAFPFIFSPPFSEKMSFFERLINLFTFIEYTAFPQVPTMDDSFVRDYAADLPYVSLNTLAGRSVLWLLDTDVILDYPRPYMPNEIQIGGLTTFQRTKALPPELEDYVTNAPEGVILVSFGSSEAPLPDVAVEKLVAVFKRLPQRIIWRYPIKAPSGEMPDNVKIMAWLPQYDLLAHNNTRLFVTHCGANSQFEAVYHATPMVGVPMFAEQAYNAKRMDYHQYGRAIPRILEFTEEQLYEAITEVLGNQVYKESITKASKIFRSRRETPKEQAVYWIEHVIQHGGQHLRSYALDMPWYQYLMLDILVFILIIFVILITAIIYAMMKCICSCSRKQKSD